MVDLFGLTANIIGEAQCQSSGDISRMSPYRKDGESPGWQSQYQYSTWFMHRVAAVRLMTKLSFPATQRLVATVRVQFRRTVAFLLWMAMSSKADLMMSRQLHQDFVLENDFTGEELRIATEVEV